jgi:hypothetical protein
MKQQKIYEVAVIAIGSLNTIRQKAPTVTYFSNLKKCVEQVSAALALNGWTDRLNYSGVYRSLQNKEKFHVEYGVLGNKIFRITITIRIINPSLSLLGIEEKPQ